VAIRFGVFVPQGWRLDLAEIADTVEKYEAMTKAAQAADQEEGWDSIWVFDHFHTVPTPELEATFECWTIAAKPALLVRRTLTRGEDGRGWVVGASTKSGKGRRVRLTQRAVAALKDHRKRQLEERMRLAGLWQDQGLVFASETGSLLNPSNLRNRSFKRIKARAGIREDLRFHDLRHTCATLLLSCNVNPKIVSEMLGHTSITITLNTYSHVLPDMQDSAADAMEAALGAM
jgi:integrase